MILHNDLDLSALRAFQSVVLEGSFSGGARRLGVPPSTISKRVRDLEARLGLRLIERTTRQMRVTAEGEALAYQATRLLDEADTLLRAMTETGTASRGHLRIAAPNLLGQMLIGKIAALCRARFPEVTLEFVFTDAAPDLIQDRFDAVIRFGPLEDSSQIARKLLSGAVRLVAAPGLEGIDRIAHPQDVANLPIIHVPSPWGHVWMFHHNSEAVTVRYKPVVSFPSMIAARDAAIAGAGVTMLPGILAEPEINAGRLVRLLPEWTGPEKTLYVVYGAPDSVTPRLRGFLDILNAELRRR